MSESFDPYHTWLGIPPAERPPNHYRLLGIPPFEPSELTIEHAANQRMAYLRTLQTGRHASDSQRLLNEVAAARICLLNPEKKAAYDEDLRSQMAAQGAAAPLAAEAPAGEPGPGRAFGEYEILQRLGGDEGGGVFQARHGTLGRIVALKVLSPQKGQTAEALQRFRRKARILAQLSHPNLVAAYDAGCRDGAWFLAMEYVEGPDLAALVGQRGRLGVSEAVGYARQAAAGLGLAHRHGVFHRNVKPSNLLLGPVGTVKVIGLGLARVDFDALAGSADFGGEITSPGRVMGTLDYMSPEQSEDSTRVDARSDVYSLGCTLYKLLTGQAMYPVKSKMKKVLAHRSAAIPSLCAACPAAPAGLEQVVTRMVAKKPEDRYASMDEVMGALAEW